MDGAFSSLLGQVDASIEQRSSLVAALRAKLGEESAGETLILDAKGSAGVLPASKPEPDPQHSRQQQSPRQAPGALLTVPGGDSFNDAIAQLDRGLDARQKLIEALKAQLSKSAAYPKSAPPAAVGLQEWDPGAASPAPPATPLDALRGSVDGPAAKRPRTAESFPSQQNSKVPKAAPFPGSCSSSSEAEATRSSAAPSTLPGGTPLTPLSAPEVGLGSPWQGSAGEVPGMSGSTGLPPTSPPPPSVPPGTTPEQMEAYRQHCWKKYFEYCSLYQKYYNQSSTKAAQSKAKSRPPVPAAASTPLDSAVRGRGSAMAAWPLAPAAATTAAGRGAPLHAAGSPPPVKSLVEDDIHSKLLGL